MLMSTPYILDNSVRQEWAINLARGHFEKAMFSGGAYISYRRWAINFAQEPLSEGRI